MIVIFLLVLALWKSSSKQQKKFFYVDDGVSWTTWEREGFKAMMADIEDGKVATAITKELSRLGRDYLKTGELIEMVFPD